MEDKTLYAVIEIGSKQYLVKVGDKIVAEKLDLKDGDKLTVKEVLLTTDGEKTQDPLVKAEPGNLRVAADTGSSAAAPPVSSCHAIEARRRTCRRCTRGTPARDRHDAARTLVSTSPAAGPSS